MTLLNMEETLKPDAYLEVTHYFSQNLDARF